jgi:hypothetical protein
VGDVPLVIEDTLANDLRKKSFVIVKPETLEDLVIDLRPGYGELQLSDEAAANLAKQVDAEVVILGKGFARLSGNVLGRDTKSVEAQMSVRAVRAENGMVVAASEGSGAAAHANATVAGTEALSLAASSVAEELSRKLAVNWGGQTSEWVLVELVVKGVKEYRDFVEFRTTISKEVPGIKNVYLKAIKAGEAKMDVEVKGDSRILADELLLKRFDDFGIDIIEVGQKAIILELIPKQDLLGEPQASSQETDLKN